MTNSIFNFRPKNMRLFGFPLYSISALSALLLLSHFGPSAPVVPESINQDDSIESACRITNKTFKGGETITYKLYYTLSFVWVAAGEVTFTVSDKGSMYHIKADGKTYPAFDPFFKVRDKYDCMVDKKSLLPYESTRQVREGGYRLYDKVIYDQRSGTATSFRGKTVSEAKRKTYDIEPCMHDVLSIIYYTRNLDFNQMNTGNEVPVKIFMDKEIWPLEVEYLGKEENVKIKGQGRFNTIKFRPDVISGYVFKKGTEMNVWVSDDKNRLPLMIESPVSVGKVKAVIKEYNGLKYDLDSKVKK